MKTHSAFVAFQFFRESTSRVVHLAYDNLRVSTNLESVHIVF